MTRPLSLPLAKEGKGQCGAGLLGLSKVDDGAEGIAALAQKFGLLSHTSKLLESLGVVGVRLILLRSAARLKIQS